MLSLPASLRLKSRVRWMLEFQHGKKELRMPWKSRFVGLELLTNFHPLTCLALTPTFMSCQDKNPPFDIGSYGEQILDTLSSRTDNTGTASFSEIVSGRPKYEVARTFSALLQLVNFPFLPVS